MVNRKSLITAGEKSFRKTSNRAVSVGLQLEKLETLLCETSRNYCENNALVHQIRLQFGGLAARKNFSNKELSRQELGDIIDSLKEILNFSPNLPPKLVAYMHSTIGLVRQLRGENNSAVTSFMRALWIATAAKEPNDEEVGLTIHRLGIVHGRNGDHNEAATLLEKALGAYKNAGLPENHPLVMSVSTELETLRARLEKDLWRTNSASTRVFSSQSKPIETVDRRLSS